MLVCTKVDESFSIVESDFTRESSFATFNRYLSNSKLLLSTALNRQANYSSEFPIQC